jgi:hypothetical protein
MEQTNVISFPTQPPESERLRLYHDDPCIVLVLAAVRRSIAPGIRTDTSRLRGRRAGGNVYPFGNVPPVP